MTSLNQADAIIFDLRDNQGGSPEMVALSPVTFSIILRIWRTFITGPRTQRCNPGPCHP